MHTYLESSRRIGGFSIEPGPNMSPLPFPGLIRVTVFLVSAFNPMTDSGTTLSFFGRWSVFSEDFLFVDKLAGPVPLWG